MRNVTVCRCSYTLTGEHIKSNSLWYDGVVFLFGESSYYIVSMEGKRVNKVRHYNLTPALGCFVTCVDDKEDEE